MEGGRVQKVNSPGELLIVCWLQNDATGLLGSITGLPRIYFCDPPTAASIKLYVIDFFLFHLSCLCTKVWKPHVVFTTILCVHPPKGWALFCWRMCFQGSRHIIFNVRRGSGKTLLFNLGYSAHLPNAKCGHRWGLTIF